MIKFVVFTDLDGTLLDEKYECERAVPVLETLKDLDVPVIFCSAKTRAEQEYFRNRLRVHDPFIVEDGSAIYSPKGYFRRTLGMRRNGYEAVVLGVDRKRIVEKIEELRSRYRIVCYYHMTLEEVAKVTGLSFEMAKRAMDREFSETIVEAEKGALDELRKDFNVVVGGKFVHVYGRDADKGKAVKILTKRFREEFGNVITVGIGNSYTDEPMLRAVDIPALVRNPDGYAGIDIEGLYRAKGISTEGWVEVIERFVLRGMVG